MGEWVDIKKMLNSIKELLSELLEQFYGLAIIAIVILAGATILGAGLAWIIKFTITKILNIC